MIHFLPNMNNIQKKLAESIHFYLSAGLDPREAIPKAINHVGIKLSPPSIEYLIQVHEKEIDRLKGLQSNSEKKIEVESPPIIMVVKDGGGYSRAMKDILQEKK